MKLIDKIINFGMRTFGVLAQDAGNHGGERIVTEGMPELIREVAAEGAVLEFYGDAFFRDQVYYDFAIEKLIDFSELEIVEK